MAFRERRPLATRVLVGVALAALGLACLWAGTWAFAALVALTAALAWREWARLHALSYSASRSGLIGVPGLVLLATLGQTYALVAVMLLVGLIFANEKFAGRRHPVAGGLLYIGLPALGLVWLDGQADGRRWVEWTVGIVCAADIAAFACGRLIGGPRLWPRLSPNKTWAGFAGALVGATSASAVLAGLVGIAPVPALGIGFALGGLAMAGDLFESWMKRRVGRKDSGSILPGHGGILDRLDGLAPVATVVAGGVWMMSW